MMDIPRRAGCRQGLTARSLCRLQQARLPYSPTMRMPASS